MQIPVPTQHQMFVNARAVLYRPAEDGSEYLVQTRDRPGQRPCLEFPGGTVETYEPLLEALAREVREETGLRVVEIEGRDTRVVAEAPAVRDDVSPAQVECLRPFAAYQTTAGFNGMGLYFRCRAEGELLDRGDGSRDLRWVPGKTLRAWLAEDSSRFNAITAAVIMLLDQEGAL